MLFAACATTRPASASRKQPNLASGAPTARRPPISPEHSVIGNTLARMIRSQRETRSISAPFGRFWVAMTAPQFETTELRDDMERSFAGETARRKLLESATRGRLTAPCAAVDRGN